ncbi:protein kinase [Nanoarchaeota archaeon]
MNIEHEKDIEFIKDILSDKYQNIQYLKEGGTRRTYLAEWGPGKEKRVIKIDKDPESPRAKRHVERGCVTERDIEFLAQIKDPEQHRLVRLCDFEVKDGRTISVESHFESKTLEETVKEEGVLNRREFETAFSHVIEGTRYLDEIGLYHRDEKPSNILIKRDKGGIEARITDFANACKKSQPKRKYLPTMGGHLITDPNLIGEFTGTETNYNETSEVYALGVDMFYALTGKYIFEYDYDTRTARDFKGRNLLNENGRLDKEKHERTLEEALTFLPRESRKYSGIIKNCLTLDDTVRYDSVHELSKDFKDKSDQIKAMKRKYLAGAGVAASILVLLATLGTGKVKNIEKYDAVRQEQVDRWSSYNSDRYQDIFSDAYDHAIRAFSDGKLDNKLKFNQRDKLIDEVSEKYALDSRLIRDILEVNRLYAGEDTKYGGRGRASDVNIFDPFLTHHFGDDLGVIDPVENLERGAKRLSELLKKHKGDEKKALIEFYSIQPKKSTFGMSWRYGTFSDSERETTEKEAKMLAWNVLNGGCKWEGHGTMHPYPYLDLTPKDF